MTHRHRVSFIKKDLKKPTSHQITHIGGTMPDGTPWTISTQEAISSITSGRFVFFVGDESAQATERIVVAHSPVYGAFLRSEKDRQMPNRLMQLPESVEEGVY